MPYHNEMSKAEFIAEHLIWIIISMFWYANILFRCIENHSLYASRLILCGILAVVSIVGICFQMRKERNTFHVFLNLAIGYGLYTVLAYIKIRNQMIVLVWDVSTFLLMIYSIFVMCRKIRKKKKFWKILHKRIQKIIAASQIIYGFGLSGIIFMIIISIWMSPFLIKSTIDTPTPETIAEQTIAHHKDIVLKLQENVWKDLSTEDKINVLQTVANIEQRYLGIPNELNIRVRNLKENLLGYYDDRTHEIVISMDSLAGSSSAEVLDTVCHEAYHSYQMRLVDVYNSLDEESQNLKAFQKLKLYGEEFNYYISAEENIYSYYNQDCESDARNYAQEAVENYMQRIQEYLKE